jgi:hypothetical protein
MQRVRMSLPYFSDHGWETEVVCVDPVYADIAKDELLVKSIPSNIKVHTVKALNKNFTSKIGLGSIALRSLWFYRQKVNSLLKHEKIDLIYFSTTQFPVCILGAYWKKRFAIPYVIDMQDPWHSDYYKNKPKEQQPPKYWFSYRLNKFLESVAVKHADGLISVSEDYITDLKLRYPVIKNIPSATITFGSFDPDLKIAADNQQNFNKILKDDSINIVYIGRGGNDMHKAIVPLFHAFKAGLDSGTDKFDQLKFWFIGTSYAPAGQGRKSIQPLAGQLGIKDYVTEITDRISYYHTLVTLQQADALFIPGSDDPKYTASKIYPYLLTKKPVLAIFNKESSAIKILKEYGVRHVYDYDTINVRLLTDVLKKIAQNKLSSNEYDPAAQKKYSAKQMAIQQCQLFNTIVNGKN